MLLPTYTVPYFDMLTKSLEYYSWNIAWMMDVEDDGDE